MNSYDLLEQLGGAPLGDLRRLLLLLEVLLEQVHDFVLAHLLRCGNQAPIRAHLEMLDL